MQDCAMNVIHGLRKYFYIASGLVYFEENDF